MSTENRDSRIQRDYSLTLVAALLMAGAGATAAALVVNEWPNIRASWENSASMSYTSAVLLAAVEALLLYLIVRFADAIVRDVSMKISDEGVTQLRLLRLKRVSIKWEEVTSLTDKKGALWVSSGRNSALLGGGLSYKDPEGLIEFILERVPPGVDYSARG